jgi:metallo-beta-lactamase family protein
MRLSFHGAARTVTGSCHLLETNGRRILVDCGLFQGGRELHEDNVADFGFDPAQIDIVCLTHAHLDHCGRLPLLAKRGFRGEVIATSATFDLARLVLLDSTHLQMEEARHRQHRNSRVSSAAAPLYSMLDTLDSIGRFGRTARYGMPLELAPGIRATFFDAGHILGSASILIELDEAGRRRSILFSGDIGNAGRPLLRPPSGPRAADVVVMEATYGDRFHRSYAASVEELNDAIAATLARGGNVLIPTFALERTQEILYCLHQAIASGRLRRSLSVFLDSPMAISATEIFVRHPEARSPTLDAALSARQDPFDIPGLQMSRETADSKAINRIAGGAVILAGAGMCTGGRIRHHLLHNLANPSASVIFVGFAAQGTPARRIIDGAKSVTLLGEEVAVRAKIHTINGFSAHADQRELLAWRGRIDRVQETFVVHAEEAVMEAFASRLQGRVIMPRLHEPFDL